MFGLFKRDKDPEDKPKDRLPVPVDEERRIWLEDAFSFLFYQFDADKFFDRKVFTPTKEHFNYKFTGDKTEVERLAKQIGQIMEINFDEIQLEYFGAGIEGFGQADDVVNPGGEYLDKNENGKYIIALREDILKDPDALIATIAHEFAHVKLLGEKRLDFNDEHLTDMVPLLFGLGIFPANACFKFYGWTYSTSGYLNQMDWGYLLALFAFSREDNQPDWLQYLNKTVQKDFEVSMAFIINHRNETIFKQNDDDQTTQT